MTNYDYYITTRTKIFDQQKNNFTSAYSKARNKNTVVAIWIDVLRDKISAIQKDLAQNEIEDFKREWEKMYELDSGINEETAFEETITKYFPNLIYEQISLISQIDAYSEQIGFIESMRINTSQDSFNHPRPDNKYWIGTEETEFVQLIYALIEADRLNHKEKTRMTKTIANFLGFPLSNDWQSKLSHSIHQGNFDKKPRIFGELERAWEKYKERQIDRKLNHR